MNEEEFVALARQRYQQIQDLQAVDSFYEYKQAFDHIWTDLGKQVLRQSISHPPADRRKKKTTDPLRNHRSIKSTRVFPAGQWLSGQPLHAGTYGLCRPNRLLQSV